MALAPPACSRRREPPRAASTPAPPAADAGAATEEETPLGICQRGCSDDANHKQLAAFERCDAEAKAAAREACRSRALAATDGDRASCRRVCQDRLGAGGDR